MRNEKKWKAVFVTALAVGILPAVLAGTACAKKPAGRIPGPAPARRVLYWYDPMKPEVHFDHPGKSPFMDMELVPKIRGGGAPRRGRPGAVRPLGRADPARATAADRRDDGEGGEADDLGRRRDQRRRGRRRGPGPRGQREILRVHREALRGPHGAERAPGRAAPLRLQSRPRRDRARAPARRRERAAALGLDILRGGFRRAGAAGRDAGAPAPLGHPGRGDRAHREDRRGLPRASRSRLPSPALS